MTHLLGIEVFLDTFQHPGSYQYIKNDNVPDLKSQQGYIILQKSSSLSDSIVQGDTILYQSAKKTIECRIVYSIQIQNGEKTYYTTTPDENNLDGPIFGYQILGKTTAIIEDNFWNALSLQVWGLVIEHLNVMSFLNNS
jgi:hypothetical protein